MTRASQIRWADQEGLPSQETRWRPTKFEYRDSAGLDPAGHDQDEAFGSDPAVALAAGGNGPLRVTVLIAAHNEEESIRSTLESCLHQTLRANRVVLAADNCTDRTVEIARSIPGVEVFETIDNTHKKSGALNQGWERTKADTDLYITIDADTILPPNAIADWAAEFADPKVAGVSAKFTMMTPAEVRNLAETGRYRRRRATRRR